MTPLIILQLKKKEFEGVSGATLLSSDPSTITLLVVTLRPVTSMCLNW